MRMSANWCIAVEHWRLISIRIIFINYQTSELQCNYQSYIQMNIIGDAWGFSDKAPITPSRSFSVETLTEVTPSQKTKSNRSISAVEDRIPGQLQHHCKVCCKKDGYCRRQACIIRKLYHCGDIISGQVDLHMTQLHDYTNIPQSIHYQKAQQHR